MVPLDRIDIRRSRCLAFSVADAEFLDGARAVVRQQVGGHLAGGPEPRLVRVGRISVLRPSSTAAEITAAARGVTPSIRARYPVATGQGSGQMMNRIVPRILPPVPPTGPGLRRSSGSGDSSGWVRDAGGGLAHKGLVDWVSTVGGIRVFTDPVPGGRIRATPESRGHTLCWYNRGHRAMDDPAYKHLFGRPRMVRDLLHGFAAREWSGALDFASLTPLPASYVSDDLRQRHGDLVWRVRFHDERWLYLVLLLEFQSGVDRAMAVRILTYTALLYQKLIAEGVLRERDALPPVLPIVVYNGRRRWNAAADVSELIASGGAALARYQPSQRYFLLDEGGVGDTELPLGQPRVGADRAGDES